jgi:hypothetical protein
MIKSITTNYLSGRELTYSITTNYIAGTELTYSITSNYIAGTELTNMQIPHFYRTAVSSGAGTAYHSGTPTFIPSFSGVRVALYFTFFVMFCRSLFVLLFFSLVGIVKHFLVCMTRFLNNCQLKFLDQVRSYSI